MSAKRILVVDDSAVSRRMISEAVASDPDFEVAYAAPNATLALGFLDKHSVDLVLLDVEMPRVDGIEAVKRIRRKWSTLPVVMCSSLTERGAEVTLRALEQGASDYIPKPSAKYPRDVFREELIAKLRALLAAPGGARSPIAALPFVKPKRKRVATGQIDAVTIGCSTGGPNALAVIYKAFHRPLTVPMFIVQHMPPVFTKLLAERLGSQSGIPVKEGEHGEVVRAGVSYVAPGGFHMTVERRGVDVRIVLNEDPPEQSCRPAVDVLFRGLAKVYGGNILGAVLTGMGRDGTAGSSCIADAGGTMMIQDPGSCVVPSMPNGVAEAGNASAVLSLADIAREFDQRTRGAYSVPPAISAGGST